MKTLRVARPVRSMWVLIAMLGPVVLGPANPAWAQSDTYPIRDLERLERTFSRLAHQVEASVVAISTRRIVGSDERWVPNSQGSGFVLRSNGYIATNHHVVEGADEIVVTLFDGTRHIAKLVEFDPRSDLAVLHIDTANLRVAPFGDLSQVEPGQWCFTIGSPFGVSNGNGRFSVSFGGVAAIGRSLTDYIPNNADRFYGNLIETDASINPGNSGGPLFNLRGEIIGVNTAMMSRSGVDEGLGFAVPISSRTRGILNTLADGQVVRYGFLGVQVAAADVRRVIGPGVHNGQGALITALTGDENDSPAARSGLGEGDVITEFAGEPVRNHDDLIRLVGSTPVGSEVECVYYRNRRRSTTMVQLAERVETAAARARSTGGGQLRTMTWRGALLVEPTEAFLLSRANTKEKPGLYVAELPSRSTLYRRGLREHSLIVAVDDKQVRTLEEFDQFIAQSRGMLRLKLDDGKTISVPQ